MFPPKLGESMIHCLYGNKRTFFPFYGYTDSKCHPAGSPEELFHGTEKQGSSIQCLYIKEYFKNTWEFLKRLVNTF